MTILRVALVGAQLSTEQKQRFSARLIEAFTEVEVGRNAAEIRNGFVVMFERYGPDDVFMGDGPMADAGEVGRAAVVSAHVMAGPWDDAMKAELFRRIEAVVRDECEMTRPPGGSDFWMTFVEVPEGGWGLGGHPVAIERLAPVFAEDRQQRIRDDLRRRGDRAAPAQREIRT